MRDLPHPGGCACPGDCEGGPECLDSEGAPRDGPASRTDAARQVERGIAYMRRMYGQRAPESYDQGGFLAYGVKP